jgi:thymidine phosphorylase
MDVKFGSGAMMPELARARELAQAIVEVAVGNSLPTVALLTDMNQVLGRTAGNAVEVRESIEHLTGDARDERLLEVTLALSAELLVLGGLHADVSEARAAALDALQSGRAAERFIAMVVELGGSSDLLDAPSRHLPGAPVVRPIEPGWAGVVAAIDVRAVGIAIVNLGGGRAREDDIVDHSVGLTEVAALGERVEPGGRPLALVHARDEDSARRAADAVRAAFVLGEPPSEIPGPVAEIQRTV